MKKLFAFLTALFLLLAATPYILPGQDRPKTVWTDVLTEKTLTKQVAEFSAYVEKGMIDWQIPGMAVVVVKDNKIILQKGYGVRELGKDDPVNIETIFACASTTKAMTAVCMGILVDEGKLNWDDKVNKFLPEFKVNDPYITSELRIRDLLTHNSGIGNTDFLWGLMDISNQEIVDRMSLVRPSYSLRSGFIYQNIFYLIAGEVIAKVSKLSWEDFIKQRIFDPLGMKRSFARYSMLPDQNRSTPHYMIHDTVMKITPFPADNIAPAGSVRSCIEDMGKWVLCMLDSSKYQNGRLLKPETWNELFRPQVIIRDEMYPTSRIIKPNWSTYGLGWFQEDYKGKKINFHTGSLDGEIALNGQLPSYKLGIYVFGNLDHAELRHALMYRAFDLFALGGSTDWSSDFRKLYKGITDTIKAEDDKKWLVKFPDTSPSKPLAEYAGKYSDPLYGDVEVVITGKNLEISINKFVNATLYHWHYDTFQGSFDNAWLGKFTAIFLLNWKGEIDKLNIDGMEFVKKRS